MIRTGPDRTKTQPLYGRVFCWCARLEEVRTYLIRSMYQD